MASPFELEFGDSPFDGHPRSFADAKALICKHSKKAGVAWITAAGESLLKAKGKLSSADYEDDAKLAEFFTNETNYFKTLTITKMAACKRAIDTKSELYTGLNAQGKRDLQASTLEMYFQDANCSFIHALREHFAPMDCAKQASSKGNMAQKLRSLLRTDQVVKLLNGDPSDFPEDMDQTPWKQPAVKMWMSILDLFEGKGKSGANSFYATMRSTVASVHPQKKAPADFATAKLELEALYATLKVQYADDVEGLCNRLLSEQLVEMFDALSRKPGEEEAWRRAHNMCLEQQQTGSIDLKCTNNAADVALAMLAAGTGGGAKKQTAPPRNGNGKRQHQSRESDIEVLAAKVAAKLNAGGTPTRTRSSAKGKENNSSTQPCPHCGKVHKAPPSECWERPGARNGQRAKERQVLKAAAKLKEMSASDEEISEDADSLNESDLYSPTLTLLPAHVPVPTECKPMRGAVVLVAQPTMAQPDTQAQVTVSPDVRHVQKNHHQKVRLRGIAGTAAVDAQVVDLAVPLETDNGTKFNLIIRRQHGKGGGLYTPEASALILAHDDLQEAGMHVDYTAGKILTPTAEEITMVKQDRTWRIPVWQHVMSTRFVSCSAPSATTKMSEVKCFNSYAQLSIDDSDDVEASGDDQAAEDTTSDSSNTCACDRDAHPNVALQDRIWMGRSPTSLLKIYDYYKRAGFGHATKADIRRYRCPTCQLYLGKAKYVTSARVREGQKHRTAPHSRVRWRDQNDVLFFYRCQPPNAIGVSAQGESVTPAPQPQQPRGSSCSGGARTEGERINLPAFSPIFKSQAGIRKGPGIGQVWHMDWGDMGHTTAGLLGERYALVVVNGDNDMLDVTCTKTRQQPWKHLDDLAARWGHYPAMIRCDNAYEFVNDTRFKAWCEKHQITLDPVEGYRHRMQGRVENAVNEVKSHSRIALGHAGLPARFWSETSRMVAAIHNVFPREGSTAFRRAQPHNLHFDPNQLFHVAGCLVIIKLAKDHPRVQDSSNGPRGLEGLFFGCHPTSPLVRVWVPSLGKIVLSKNVEIYDNRFPYKERCMHNLEGFTKAEIADMAPARDPLASFTTPTVIADQPESNDENAVVTDDIAPTPAPDTASVGPTLRSRSRPAAVAAQSDPDFISEATDTALANFSARRQLMLNLPAQSFYDNAWRVKCVGTKRIRQRLHVVVETLSGETDALTAMDRGKQFDLPVSRSLDKRDVNLRRAIQLQHPTPVTLQDLVPLCVTQQPFPSFEGEKRVTDTSKAAKEGDVVRIKGREFLENTKLDTLDDPTLARILVRHQKPLNLETGVIVEPIGVRRNKGRTYLEYRYVKPQDKAKSNELGDLPMTSKDPDVRSVRDVINVMHKWPETLKQIGIDAATANTVTQAKMAAWSAMLADWKAVGPEWNVSRQRGQLDGPFEDVKMQERWAYAAAAQAKTPDEAIDLSWIDMHEPDPKSDRQAHKNPRLSPIWKSEEGIEMDGLFKRECLRKRRRSELPDDARVIGSRFHYKIKRHQGGEMRNKVKRLKVRLVVQGQHMSKEKGDFMNAFAPVPHMSGIRTVMSIATKKGWKARGFDLTQGFIQSDLPDDGKTIYIRPPRGYESDPDIVYEVLRPLYGMPHSGRCLHVTWSTWLQEQGFKKVGYEGAMFAWTDGEDRILIATHVDDSIITGSNDEKTDALFERMRGRFDGTVEEDVSELLGMEWERDLENASSKLHQAAYTEKMLKSFGYWGYHKPPRTPMLPGTRLGKTSAPLDAQAHTKYRAIVGALGWLAQATRPDICQSYSELSKHVQRPGQEHMRAAEHCLKYLAGTPRDGIHYGGRVEADDTGRGSNQLWGFVDADFASDEETRRSHTGYCLFLNGGPVSWKSTRQKSVSLSTAEAEWYAASEAGKEIVYLRYILEQFGLPQRQATKLYEDSRAVICMAENPVNRKASRHIDTRRHWIGEAVAAKVIELIACRTHKMVADALTKSLPAPVFEQHKRSMLGLDDKPFSINTAYVSGG